MNRKKILFTDLDGTLLNDEKEITKDNLTAIKQALSAGHKIVLTTGRALSSAKIQAAKIGFTMPGCYLIAFNGGCIYDVCEGKVLHERTIPREYARELFRIAKEMKIYIQAYDREGIVVDAESEIVRRHAASENMKYRVIGNLQEGLSEDPPKLLLIDYDSPKPLEDFSRRIWEWSKGKVDFFFSSPQYLDVAPYGVSKGYAVRFLCDYLNFSLGNSISAGDAENDINMLETTFVSAVMRNAPENVKKYGTYITRNDNNHSGVAEIIHTFML